MRLEEAGQRRTGAAPGIGTETVPSRRLLPLIHLRERPITESSSRQCSSRYPLARLDQSHYTRLFSTGNSKSYCRTCGSTAGCASNRATRCSTHSWWALKNGSALLCHSLCNASSLTRSSCYCFDSTSEDGAYTHSPSWRLSGALR